MCQYLHFSIQCKCNVPWPFPSYSSTQSNAHPCFRINLVLQSHLLLPIHVFNFKHLNSVTFAVLTSSSMSILQFVCTSLQHRGLLSLSSHWCEWRYALLPPTQMPTSVLGLKCFALLFNIGWVLICIFGTVRQSSSRPLI